MNSNRNKIELIYPNSYLHLGTVRTHYGVVTKGDLKQPDSKIVVTKSMKIPNILDWRSYFKVKGGPCAVNQHEVEVFHLK